MALTGPQKALLEAAKKTALQLGELGKELTGLIGELSACEKEDLTWEPSKGYDAKTSSGQRVQIKTRRALVAPFVRKAETMGWFGRRNKSEYSFDIAMYVELDKNFSLVGKGIWQMSAAEVCQLERVGTSTWGFRVGAFKNYVESKMIEEQAGR
ncbi:MAG: hypothetical protein V1724_09585 [Chloroflexota bacterium]